MELDIQDAVFEAKEELFDKTSEVIIWTVSQKKEWFFFDAIIIDGIFRVFNTALDT